MFQAFGVYLLILAGIFLSLLRYLQGLGILSRLHTQKFIVQNFKFYFEYFIFFRAFPLYIMRIKTRDA